MSLIFSVVRITPSPFLRRITLAVAGCFLLFWAATLSLQAWWCVDDTQTVTHPGCTLPQFIIIFEMTGKYFNRFPLNPKPPIYFCIS